MAALALVRPGRGWLPGAGMPALDRIPLAIMLLLLANGLAGHRRLALQVTLGLAVIALLIPPVHPLHPGRLVLPAVIAVLLLPDRGSFSVRPDPQRLRTAFAAGTIALAVAVGRGFWAAARHGAPVRQAAYAALPVAPAAPDRSTRVFIVVN